MSKVRMYSVERKDGHGSLPPRIVPAHSGHAACSYFSNQHIAASAQYLGFYEVELFYSAAEIHFRILDNTFGSQDAGYEFLCIYMTNDINMFISELRQSGNYP